MILFTCLLRGIIKRIEVALQRIHVFYWCTSKAPKEKEKKKVLSALLFYNNIVQKQRKKVSLFSDSEQCLTLIDVYIIIPLKAPCNAWRKDGEIKLHIWLSRKF